MMRSDYPIIVSYFFVSIYFARGFPKKGGDNIYKMSYKLGLLSALTGENILLLLLYIYQNRPLEFIGYIGMFLRTYYIFV